MSLFTSHVIATFEYINDMRISITQKWLNFVHSMQDVIHFCGKYNAQKNHAQTQSWRRLVNELRQKSAFGPLNDIEERTLSQCIHALHGEYVRKANTALFLI